MAEIRCPNCGNNNPDFLDLCQVCETPLHPEPTVHIGEDPIEKDTGELENILPDWLKDAREQGRNETAADDAFQSQTRPKVPKDEPPDLLAGLMSQADSDEDEVPDWLAGINPVAEKEAPKTSSGKKDEDEPSDFFARFRQPDAEPSAPAESEPAQEEDTPAWLGGTKEQPAEQEMSFDFDDTTGTASEDDWMKNLGSFDAPAQEPAPQKEPEDLSWLHDLEASSKGTGELDVPQKDTGFDFAPASSDGEDLSWLNNLGGTSASAFEEPTPSQPASSDDDMSWLNNLGGTPAPSFEEPAPSQPASSDDDMSWLNNLGGTPASAFEEPTPSQPASSDDDLSWLNNLGGTPAPASEEPIPSQPASTDEDLDWLSNLGGTPAPATEEFSAAQPSSSDEDLDWLNNLGGTSAPAFDEPKSSQPASSQDDLDWLSNLGGPSEPSAETSTKAFADTSELKSREGVPSSSKPFQTAPLNELLGDDSVKDTTPDWLKNAMEEPSMPLPGEISMDWFSEQDKASSSASAGQQIDEFTAPTQDEPASSASAFDFSMGDSSASSAQDVDALFDVDMPDWLSREPEAAETSQPDAESTSAFADESLAPVELPSWVQAMRPVDSAISGTTANDVEQVTETEGPLAGFSGVLPAIPIGSSLRPKAFSMKLLVTDEQQASASLIEQIIGSETSVQAIKPVAVISSQRVLRWVLSGLFLVLLGVVIGLGWTNMPIVPSAGLSNLVSNMPDSAPVLVVIDYDPAFSGELEAAAGPLLDQLALLRHSTFTFVSMSPNGSALVDRLMFNTKISLPAEKGGLGYQSGEQYFNLGFLPGGSSGVLGFIENSSGAFSKFEAIILMTDNAETGRVWVEQLEATSPENADKTLFMVSSAQAGPMLQPYVSSGQADILVNGLYDAAGYESMNTTRPGIARAYWDAFGVGIMMAIVAIVLGSVWSVVVRIRERRAEMEEG